MPMRVSWDGQILDITGTDAHFEPIEVRIREDGKVLWVNVGILCRLRICQINSRITIEDDRPRAT